MENYFCTRLFSITHRLGQFFVVSIESCSCCLLFEAFAVIMSSDVSKYPHSRMRIFNFDIRRGGCPINLRIAFFFQITWIFSWISYFLIHPHRHFFSLQFCGCGCQFFMRMLHGCEFSIYHKLWRVGVPSSNVYNIHGDDWIKYRFEIIHTFVWHDFLVLLYITGFYGLICITKCLI